MDSLFMQVHDEVLSRLDFTHELNDEEILELIKQIVREHSARQTMGLRERESLQKEVFNSLRRLDAIQELVDDEDVTEIMVNGCQAIFYEKRGEIFEWDKRFVSEDKLADTIQRIVSAHNRSVNLSSPIVDSRLEDGSRVNVVLSPISIDGSTMTIRKFPKSPLTMEQLMLVGAITKEATDFLQNAVAHGKSILISGGTGSGKTTFLNALSAAIPKDERVITIEDSAELQLKGIKNLVRLETRNTSMEETIQISIRDLIRTALRMRPDRIIVGECRGEEAFDMLQAMNTGHDGSMSTVHANSCKDSLLRLEMMVRMGMDLPLDAIRAQIASGIQLVVQLNRMADHSRKVVEIASLEGILEGNMVLKPIFLRRDGELVRVKE